MRLQSVPLYLSEMAPYKYRGALNSCFQPVLIGVLVANFQTIIVTSSSDYSSSSSEEDSKISAAKARANADRAKKIINSMPLASDSDAEEEEPIWEPMERRSRPYPPHREIERLIEDERDEEDYWDAMYNDLEEEFPSSDSDSEKEFEEDSSEDDDDDESDDSDD
ncbi:sugar transport protein 12-like [Papaver somniferum]|uniref:sugar transport protein 12-like n=1 Tax=Papaver somniferum TaxID=3469 RepID=UPI000E7000CA|nr:sugar transport protein 12-like [Papaver somniferum]